MKTSILTLEIAVTIPSFDHVDEATAQRIKDYMTGLLHRTDIPHGLKDALHHAGGRELVSASPLDIFLKVKHMEDVAT